MGGKSSSGGAQTTTNAPPAYLAPYLQNLAGEAFAAYQPFARTSGVPSIGGPTGPGPQPAIGLRAGAPQPQPSQAALAQNPALAYRYRYGDENAKREAAARLAPPQPASARAGVPGVPAAGGVVFGSSQPRIPSLSTVPPISPDRLAAFGMMRDIADNRTPYIDAAGGYVRDALAGKFAGPGGYAPAAMQAPMMPPPANMPALLDTAYRNARRSVDGGFEAAGRFGSGLNDAARAEAFAGAAAPIMEQARQFNANFGENARQFERGLTEQSRQFGYGADEQARQFDQAAMERAAMFAPSLQQAGLQDAVTRAQLLEGVGSSLEEQKRNEALGRFEPLEKYAGLLSMLAGGAGSTTSTPTTKNRAAGFLGGGALGLGLGSMTAASGATGLAALGGPLGIGLALGGGLLGAMG